MAESLQAPPQPGSAAPTPPALHPIRPTWNPVEEARQRAEQQRALLEQVEAKQHRGKKPPPPPEPVDLSLTAQIAIINAERPERHQVSTGGFHHTVAPRTICVTGFFLAFAFPAIFLVLNHFGHADFIDGRFHPDDLATRISVVVLVGSGLCMALGWLWWGVAAALNARHQARWSVSPMYVPLTYFGVAAAAVAAGLSPRWLGEYSIYAKACGLAFGVVMYFSTLSAYRRTAQSIGAPTKYLTRLIIVPWAIAAGGAVFVWFERYLAPQAQVAAVMGLMLMQGLYGLTMYQAMLSIDRACVGTRMSRDDDQEFAKFLKLAR